MRHRLNVALWLLVAAPLLASCVSSTTIVRAVQHESLRPYSQARADLPPPTAGSLRLYIYRPQAIVGAWGGAIVIVNGRWFGDPANYITNNMLIPGAVFVVDVPDGTAHVTWAQPGRPQGTDKPLELSSASSPVAYLRWTLKPTYGLLEQVPAEQATREIDPLRFSGHVALGAP